MKLKIIDPKYGHRQLQMSLQEAQQLHRDEYPSYGIVQDDRVTTRDRMQEGLDTTFVPQLAGG